MNLRSAKVPDYRGYPAAQSYTVVWLLTIFLDFAVCVVRWSCSNDIGSSFLRIDLH